ncbi:hypothetical protein BOTBODRAFT_129935 [Botryobasidium botryosum FD-172 SS1]|uniref:Uncharacterized protein n=1 Tax=Botryobasidium botryosum (strain FD-172 SS1) TaxID=930990 RepID=A0A067MYF7_BOTB1|nr:hypothetical protein BOTBODRAFT_129935 [Botryobasidium botryosum FD-172 SS1]
MQWWQVINLDKKETLGISGSLHEFLWSYKPHGLVAHLMLPAMPSVMTSSSACRWATPVTDTIEPATCLGSLTIPAELIRLIFREIDNFQDTFSLAHANTRLLDIGRDRVCALLRCTVAPWAGDRLICIGEEANSDDLPDGMLTATEMQQLESFTTKDCAEWCEGDVVEPANLYFFADAKYRAPKDYGYSSPGFTQRLSTSERVQYGRLLKSMHLSESDHPRILCNLSKREYVRLGAVAGLAKDTLAHPWFPGDRWKFGAALVSRICWSSIPISDADSSTHRGVWAGDRFEITTLDTFPHCPDGEAGWKDVSEEMAQHLGRL